MSALLYMEVKFFPRDVVSGKADKVGDEFTAFFLNGNHPFKVVSHHGSFFMAELL